jgi:quercetin dioxygenase-like cupin family protein
MEKMSLTALAREQLQVARTASSGRRAQTVYGGHEHVLRQTLISIVAGQALEERNSPRDATVYVLNGRVRLIVGSNSWDGMVGDLLIVPDSCHTLEALVDATVLLTVGMHIPAEPAADDHPHRIRRCDT